MQCLKCGVLVEFGDVFTDVFGSGGSNNGAQIEEISALFVDRFLSDSPRIHILSGLQGIDRKKRLTFVFECRRDRSLKETIERQQVLRRGRRAGFFVELFERAIRRERFADVAAPRKVSERFDQLRSTSRLPCARPRVSFERSGARRIVCVLSMIGWLFSSGQ